MKAYSVSRTASSAAIALFILTNGHPCLAQEAPKVIPQVSLDGYKELMDTIYPPPNRRGPGLFNLVIRFDPSFHAESELIVQVNRDGTAEADLYSVVGPSVWSTACEYVRRNGKEDLPEIAKSIKMTKTVTFLSAEKMNWFRTGLSAAIAGTQKKLDEEAVDYQRDGNTTLTLDGTSYSLKYAQVLSNVSWSFVDAEEGALDNAYRWPLVRWMNRLKGFVLEQKSTAVAVR